MVHENPVATDHGLAAAARIKGGLLRGRAIIVWAHSTMQRNVTLSLSVIATVFLVALGYAWMTGTADRKETAPKEEPRPIELAIADIQRKLRDAPGRKGILAEKKRYSVFDEELIIRDFFQDRKNGFFLDVGCAWPVAGNNTYYLERHLGWKGIAVDALEDYGPAWSEKRPGSRFFSYLVTDHSGTSDIFFKSPDSGLSSTDRNMASGKMFGEDMEPEEVSIPTITLSDLLDREGVAKIDLLAMDIEGHEPRALAGFDIDRFQPELVVIEGGTGAVAAYFAEHGYALIERYLPFDSVNRYFERKQ